MEKEWVELPDGKKIGYIEGEVFYKTGVRSSIHQLRVPPAWAIDADIWDKVSDRVNIISIFDMDTGKEYYSKVDDFDRHRGQTDRGSGRQYFLVMKYWLVKGEKSIGIQQPLSL